MGEHFAMTNVSLFEALLLKIRLNINSTSPHYFCEVCFVPWHGKISPPFFANCMHCSLSRLLKASCSLHFSPISLAAEYKPRQDKLKSKNRHHYTSNNLNSNPNGNRSYGGGTKLQGGEETSGFCRFVGSCRNFFEGPKVLESSVVQCAAPRSPSRTGCSWSRATTDIFSHMVNLRVFGSVFAKTARFR